MTYSANFNAQKEFFLSGETHAVNFRRHSLLKLRQSIIHHEQPLLHALHQDLGKSPIEAYTSEIGYVISEINFTLKHLKSWSRTKKRPTPLLHFPAKSQIIPQPKGLVLIISPWNYPLGLSLTPLVGALAAGNCVVIKPSELAPMTAQVIQSMIQETFPSHYCDVVPGDKTVGQQLLTYPWDHIFFTGSTTVGKKVMAAAAKTLTPVTLELGGKNPCILLEDTNLDVAAKRIVWSKFLNAGQTCVAPDHVFVPRYLKNQLTQALIASIKSFYGSAPIESKDYARVINKVHFNRLKDYLKDGDIIWGGQIDEASNYFSPTLMENIHPDSPLLHGEIFGPILPIISYDDLNPLLDQIAAQPKPLALYLFTQDKQQQQSILKKLPSGTAAVNDALNQIISSHLPLGGLGHSGMGSYHGQASFDCFTHYRSILIQSPRQLLNFAYPPYKISLAFLKFIYQRLLK